MKHTVRSKEGELVYGSFREVEQAWLMGLIDPDDEVQEHGTTRWRKAGKIPLLVQARRQGASVWKGSLMLLSVVGIGAGSVAIYLLLKQEFLWGGLLAVVVALTLVQITMRANKQRKPHG